MCIGKLVRLERGDWLLWLARNEQPQVKLCDKNVFKEVLAIIYAHAAFVAAYELHAPMDAALTYLVIHFRVWHLADNLYIMLFRSCNSFSVSLQAACGLQRCMQTFLP